MAAPSNWIPYLRNRNSRKVVLLTVSPTGMDPFDQNRHLALEPGSLTYATHVGADITHTSSGRLVPFLPLIIEWPQLERSLSTTTRQAEVASVTIRLAPSAGATAAFSSIKYEKVTARLDLWTDGLDLESVIPLLAGTVTGDIEHTRHGGPVSFSVSDGDPTIDTSFPAGLLERENFPDAPPTVVGSASRRFLAGRHDGIIYCHQVDQEGRTFYICDSPTLTSPPAIVTKGGKPITSGWRHQVIDGPRFPYSAVVLDSPVRQLAPGLNDEVWVEGVSGESGSNIIEWLCRNVLGIGLSSRAQTIIKALDNDFPMSVNIDSESSAMSLLFDRFLPQIPYVGTLHLNQLDLYPLDLSQAPRAHAILGGNLLYRYDDQGSSTPMDELYSVIEVRGGRTQAGQSSGFLATALRHASRGPSETRSLLSRSPSRQSLTIEANDLLVTVDEMFVPTDFASGSRLADVLAKIHAVPHRTHVYHTTWEFGLGLGFDHAIMLTDAREGLTSVPCRLRRLDLGPTGPVVSLETLDYDLLE